MDRDSRLAVQDKNFQGWCQMIKEPFRALDIRDVIETAGKCWAERTAISDDDVSFSYAQLAFHARQMGSSLDRLNIPVGAYVGLMPERNAESLVLYIALMAAGAVPVVLPEVPHQTLLRHAEALGLSFVVSAVSGASPLGCISTKYWTDLCRGGDSDVFGRGRHNLATLTLTSGSTGFPKAVMVTHSNLLHYAYGLLDRIDGWQRPMRFGNLTSLAADLGHTAIFPALLSGGSVHIADRVTARDPARFWAWARRSQLDVVKSTPSQFSAVLDGRSAGDWCFPLLILGGERLTGPLAQSIFECGAASKLVNHYGPSETTVGAACQVFRSPADLPADGGDLPIGTAIGEASLRLLPLSEGQEDTGELAIGGPGVTHGYCHQPELTAARFPTMPDGERVYRTGDIFQRLASGGLRFLGRIDRQIKVSGYAVDLSDVERVVEEDPWVRRAVVFHRMVQDVTQIVAMVEPAVDLEPRSDALEGLRARLAEQLPRWACPSLICPITHIPVNDNGKFDYSGAAEILEERLAIDRSTRSSLGGGEPELAENLTQRILDISRELLGSQSLSPSDDFSQSGLDSILIMRLISKLRNQGLFCTLDAIGRHNSAAALAGHIERTSLDEQQTESASGLNERRLSPIQRWFFKQGFDRPNHWNQALVLESAAPIDARALARAVGALRERHPILAQAFDSTIGAVLVDARNDAPDAELVITQLPRNAAAREKAFRAACREGQTGLDLAKGKLIRVHLFQGDDGDDRILLIVHHLVVDGVSWRILLDDLLAAYVAFKEGRFWPQYVAASFWDWTSRIAEVQPSAAEDVSKSIFPLREPAARRQDLPDSIVLVLSEAQTMAFHKACSTPANLEATLALAIADAVSEVAAVRSVPIEVEAHGRDLVPGAERFYDSLGWCTTLYRITIDAGNNYTFAERLDQTRLALAGRASDAAGLDALPRDVCFNLLGSFSSLHNAGIQWRLGGRYCGPARSAADDSTYAVRVTARTVDGRMSIDLVTDPNRVDRRSADRILGRIRERIALSIRCTPASVGRLRREVGSTSGLIVHAQPVQNVYEAVKPKSVLVTGSTGFLGAFLVNAMLRSGDYRPLCLVRGSSETHASKRFFETYEHYFGATAARSAAEQVTVYRGDVTVNGLGLPPDLAEREAVRAIFHLAADTRLVTIPQENGDANVAAASSIIEWSAVNGGIDLHHVSTLAVAGVSSGMLRVFDEAECDFGQSFLAPYEAGKLEAEKLVRATEDLRAGTYIYRMGHLAAHSRSGVFQRNIGANRIYQTLRAYVLACAAPSDPAGTIAFSNVDIVTEALLAFCEVDNIPTGTFHLESPHEVDVPTLVAWMNSFGYTVELISPEAYAARLHELSIVGADRAIHAAAYWAKRKARNICYDSSYSQNLMGEMGLTFPPPTESWFHRLLSHAIHAGFLPEPKRAASHARGRVATLKRSLHGQPTD